jgi:hypothetical protein
MHQRYTVKSLFFMLSSSARRANHDGRVRPTYRAVNPLVLDFQLNISVYSADLQNGSYLANERQRFMLMPRSTKVRSMHRKQNIRLSANTALKRVHQLHPQGVNHLRRDGKTIEVAAEPSWWYLSYS